MSRPARYRLLFSMLCIACLVLPDVIRLPFLGAVLVLTVSSYAVAHRFFAGRRALKKKQWIDAVSSFHAFEAELTQTPWKRTMSWLAAGVYTRDPIAIARNNIGVVHLENGKLDLATASFRSALELDARYAVPHVNLAVVAARQNDSATMEKELAEATRLGLGSKRVHQRVRAALTAA
jgi:hypothetical protein